MIIKKIMIKNMLEEMIVIIKEYKVIIVIKNKVMIVQKIIFMIIRERVLLATPGNRDKDWMPPYSSTTEKFQSCNN